MKIVPPTEEEYAQRRKFGLGLTSIFPALVRVSVAAAQGEKLIVSNHEQAERLAICATCGLYTGLTCKKCGCHIRFKARLETEHCPINKW